MVAGKMREKVTIQGRAAGTMDTEADRTYRSIWPCFYYGLYVPLPNKSAARKPVNSGFVQFHDIGQRSSPPGSLN